MRPVKRLVSLHIETPKLAESVEFYTRGFGLEIASADDRATSLKGAGNDIPILMISTASTPRLVGLTFALATASDIQQSREALASQGVEFVSDAPVSATASITILDPDHRRITFVADNSQPKCEPTADGRPLFLSHVVLNSTDHQRLTSFFTDVLGFTIADRYEGDLLTFIRCDQPQHHCIGVSPAAKSCLNHFSVEVGSIDSVMRGVGRMQRQKAAPIWGPGRHGPGGNVFCYFEDPSGFVAEFTCDVIQIENDADWVAKEWPRIPEIGNVWGTGGPSPRAIELMSGGHLPGRP